MNYGKWILWALAVLSLFSCENPQAEQYNSCLGDEFVVSSDLSEQFSSSTGLSKYIAKESGFFLVVAPEAIKDNDDFWVVPLRVKLALEKKLQINLGPSNTSNRKYKVFIFESRSDCYDSLDFIDKVCGIGSSATLPPLATFPGCSCLSSQHQEAQRPSCHAGFRWLNRRGGHGLPPLS